MKNRDGHDPPWYDSAWSRRRTITANRDKVIGSEDLVNIPLLYDHETDEFKAAQPSGADFVFTSDDGVTKLSHEIRAWDPSRGRLTVYVKVPRLSPHRDTVLFLYYGNAAASDQQDPRGVWSECAYVGKPGPLAERAMQLLESLFDDPGLARLRSSNATHPAIVRYEALLAVLEHRAMSWPGDIERIGQAGAAVLDVLDFGVGEREGAWLKVAEPEALRQIRTRLDRADKFADQLAVVRCWILLREQGISAVLIERKGYPDIRAQVDNNDVWVEVKRIRVGTDASRVRKVLAKANRQLKTAVPASSGVVYLEVSRPVEVSSLSEEMPEPVQTCLHEVERELGSGNSKSVGKVVISWDEMSFLGTPPGLVLMALRRRTVSRDHRSPRSVPPLEFGPSAGRTLEMTITWAGTVAEAVRT